MSECHVEIGDDVSFFRGEGEVVDINSRNQSDLLKIQTRDGQLRVIPSDIACAKRI